MREPTIPLNKTFKQSGSRTLGDDLSFGLIPAVFKDISFNTETTDILSSPYYKTAVSIFNYLCNHQRKDGSILDPNILSTLDAQYHYASMGLGAVILFLLTGQEEYYARAYTTLKYYKDVPMEMKRGGVDFSNFPFLLSYMLMHDRDDKCRLKALLRNYVDNITHHANVEKGTTYGNNFVTLRALNQLLRFMIIGEDKDRELADTFMNHSLKWQFDDGVFYDFPRSFNNEKGIPSLTYHSKITLITLLYGIISGDKVITDRALFGVEALVKLTADDGEAFYYGRTNNALYGYACGLLALRIASNYLKEGDKAESFKRCERSLFQYFSRHRAKDGHLYIVPNEYEEERCGFDSYMYITVYNAFTMAILLLSLLIKDIVTPEGSTKRRVDFFKNSGFFIKKSDMISVAFNLKGHNYYEQYLLDPRFTCITPLFVKTGGSDIIPTIPFSPHNSAQETESPVKKIRRKMGEYISELSCWSHLRHYNPLYAGFIPYLANTNNLHMPLNVTDAEVVEINDLVYIRTTGRFVSVKSAGIQPFIISIADTIRGRLKETRNSSKEKLVRNTDSLFYRTIVIGDNFIYFHDRIESKIKCEAFFNMRTFLDGLTDVSDGRFHFKSKDNDGFVLLLEKGDTVRKNKTLCSSKGRVCYWDVSNKDRYFILDDKKTISFEHTLIPYNSEGALRESLENFNILLPLIHGRLNTGLHGGNIDGR